MRPVHLARHGQTESNLAQRYAGRNSELLTPTGRQQAEELASTLNGFSLGRIWVSPIARARETATIVATRHGLRIEVDSRLTEIKMGPWKGMTETEVEAAYPTDFQRWQTEPHLLQLPGRETLAEVAERTMAAVRDAAASSDDLLLVTHAAPIRVAILATLGRPLSLYKKVPIANTGLVRLDLSAGTAHRVPDEISLASELPMDL